MAGKGSNKAAIEAVDGYFTEIDKKYFWSDKKRSLAERVLPYKETIVKN